MLKAFSIGLAMAAVGVGVALAAAQPAAQGGGGGQGGPPRPPQMSLNPAAAPAGHCKLDESHASLLTRTRHLSAGYTVFRFNTISGTLDWNPADVTQSKVTINIDPKSIDNPWRSAPGGGTFAQLITGPAWLDAFTHNRATFVSTRVTRTDGTHGVVEGDLTLKGVTKPVAIQTEFLAAGNDGRVPTLAFTGTATINRRDFGIDTFPAAFVGDEVQLVIDVEFNKED